jgi:predicted transcriptional regulator
MACEEKERMKRKTAKGMREELKEKRINEIILELIQDGKPITSVNVYSKHKWQENPNLKYIRKYFKELEKKGFLIKTREGSGQRCATWELTTMGKHFLLGTPPAESAGEPMTSLETVPGESAGEPMTSLETVPGESAPAKSAGEPRTTKIFNQKNNNYSFSKNYLFLLLSVTLIITVLVSFTIFHS